MEIPINKILQGDSLAVLKTIPDECVDMVITSPPYFGLRSYLAKDDPLKAKEIGSEKGIEEHIKVLMDIFRQVKRVLKPEGNFWMNYGDCYGGSNNGAHDYREEDASISASKEKYQNQKPKGGTEKSLMMLPERIALRMLDDGWILRDRICWAKQVYFHREKITKGSAMPSSVKDRFNNTWEYLFHFTKNKKYFFDLDAVRIPAQTFENRPQGIDREKEYPNAKRNANAFNYRVRDAVKKEGQPQFKASEEEIRNYKDKYKNNADSRGDDKGGPGSWVSALCKAERGKLQAQEYRDENGTLNWGKFGEAHPTKSERWVPDGGKNLPNVWLIGTEPSRELHFARFPSALCDIPILASCPKNGIVMDIFAGSGTALWRAKQLGRNYIGIELNKKYIEIAERRLAGTTNNLFTAYPQSQK